MSVGRALAIAVIVGLALAWMTGPAVAQDDEVRLNLDFNSESLNQVLQMLRRAPYNLEYTLGEGVDPDTPITLHLRDVTLEQALRSIASSQNLIAINQDGRYVFKPQPTPQEREEEETEVVPQVAGGQRTPPPAPGRTTGSYEPRRGATEGEEEDEEERDEVLEIIWPMYLGADVAAGIFGGGIIEAGGYYGGSSYGRGGYGGGSSYSRGGYGGSSYGRGGYGGSSFGRSGSSFGRSSSSFGNRGSSFGSNRNW